MKTEAESSLSLLTRQTAAWFAKTFGSPTRVQQEAWPAIAGGGPVLISAPTGTGKTLSAFLVLIDRLQELARQDQLEEKLYVIYVSPLKSLAGDIRENLKRPLEGIAKMEGGAGAEQITVGIRTGDTPQKDRQRMVKHPPHILIITPESLYLMLTSRTGRSVLHTAETLIIDELHALIDTKRGAHLMLSAARLDGLCGKPLQRIGLSATIEPLETAAQYLSPEPVRIAAPPMGKKVRIEVDGLTPAIGRKKDPVWEELAKKVYDRCQECRSVIAFSDGRRYAEKLAYYVNQLGGEGFARVHHGSISKEQRAEVEEALRDGSLRLLCATSSMELGIDVGDIDQVLQIGCPRAISSTMQRLGRAGHNPGRVSVMHMYPRTSVETLYCGMTAQVAREGGVEQARPPRLCLDVLAQHLVSMAATAAEPGAASQQGTEERPAGLAYTVDDVMEILRRAYPFRDVTRQDVKGVLAMLAGDYEHKREIPVRPRILYDRLHERVFADAYSRMLAVAAGGTIPDKGMYMAKTEEGVKVGELDEEFVYESQLGDRFLLGAFAWKIVGQDKDTVVVKQTNAEGARLPFWKGEMRGRDLRTSLAFGRIMRRLAEAEEQGGLEERLAKLGLDEAAQENTAGFLRRQLKAAGVLPDDRTVVIEHFTDSNGNHQSMIHALFGKRINAPLSLLLQDAAKKRLGCNVGCVEEEDGILLYPYEDAALPEGLLMMIDPEGVRETLEAVLPVTPVFNMTFRYNAARALMMGMRRNGRQPLWMQRLRSTEMLESLVQEKDHPLIRETRRECLEDQWDLEGVLEVIDGIRSGQIAVQEVYLDGPSPLSLPMQWRVEAAEMYEYTPTTPGIRQAVYDELRYQQQLKPTPEALQEVRQRRKRPEDAAGLHTLLMIEGDITAQELRELYPDTDVSEWLRNLAGQGAAEYVEPGLWIAKEDREEYDRAFIQKEEEAGRHLIRRLLYYRGPQTAEEVQARYLPGEETAARWLSQLCAAGEAVEDGGVYYHAKLYDRARKATIRSLRLEAVTQPASHYAALLAGRVRINAAPEQQLKQAVEELSGQSYPAAVWEEILLARRVRRYSPALLDQLLAKGDYFWKLGPGGSLSFYRYEEIDWDSEPAVMSREAAKPAEAAAEEERAVYEQLCKRGASFPKALTKAVASGDVGSRLIGLAEKGLTCADSFIPVRQWLNRGQIQGATPRQRVNARVMALSAGRWDIVRPLQVPTVEELLETCFRENRLVCKETFRRSLALRRDRQLPTDLDWSHALELLRMWELTGRVRRGYFVKGLSGAQFIRKQEYEGTVRALAKPEDQIIWLNAIDPAQPWGKALAHEEGRSFMNVPGTVVALRGGVPAMAMERQGRVLKIWEKEAMDVCLQGFVQAFRDKLIFPEKKRITVKEFPEGSGERLKAAGFTRDMLDYVLYR